MKQKVQPLISGRPWGFKLKLSFKFLNNPLTFLPPTQLLNTSFHKDFGGLAVLLPLRVPCGKDPPQGFSSWACEGPAEPTVAFHVALATSEPNKERPFFPTLPGAPKQHYWCPLVSQSPRVYSLVTLGLIRKTRIWDRYHVSAPFLSSPLPSLTPM